VAEVVNRENVRVVKTEVQLAAGRVSGNSKWDGRWRLQVTDARSKKRLLEVALPAEDFLGLMTNVYGGPVEAEVTVADNIGRYLVAESVYLPVADRERGSDEAPAEVIDEAFLLLRGRHPDINSDDWTYGHSHRNNAQQWVMVFHRYVERRPEARWR
jgi:hypothetical protein